VKVEVAINATLVIPRCAIARTSEDAPVGAPRRASRCADIHHGLNQTLSTDRRHSGILVHVHPVPPWILKLRNLSLLGPDRMDNLLRAHI
jgi:hypothetical protein